MRSIARRCSRSPRRPERAGAAAAARGDRTRERALTVRLSELRASRGEAALARALLVGWLDTSPADTDALRRLWALDRARGHWEGVVETTDRLVRPEEGAAQIDAALALADACKQLGRPEDARDGLEYARDHQPEDPALRERLAAIYEDQGAERARRRALADARARSEAGAPAGDRQRLDLLRRAGRLLPPAATEPTRSRCSRTSPRPRPAIERPSARCSRRYSRRACAARRSSA
ncbi:MAG: hypothetical protein R3A51_02370 [Nannocystaceae bacterium]